MVRDLGFIRADGKTLIGQPHLDSFRRWTLDDLQKLGVEVRSPNIETAKAMGLPSGDWSDWAGACNGQEIPLVAA